MRIFGPGIENSFETFTEHHIITMLILAIFWIIIPFIFKNKKDTKADRIFCFSLAAILILQYLGWIVWELVNKEFKAFGAGGTSLPLNLCDISIFFCSYLLITRNKKMFEIIYFWALAGTIQSYITPNISRDFPHYEYIAFYIQHFAEILTIIYLTFVHKFRPKPVSMIKTFGYLLLFVGFVYIINLLTGSNYMFLMADTPNPSTVSKMIKIFGPPPRHTIGLMFVAIISIVILYIPFAVKDLIKKCQHLTDR